MVTGRGSGKKRGEERKGMGEGDEKGRGMVEYSLLRHGERLYTEEIKERCVGHVGREAP